MCEQCLTVHYPNISSILFCVKKRRPGIAKLTSGPPEEGHRRFSPAEEAQM